MFIKPPVCLAAKLRASAQLRLAFLLCSDAFGGMKRYIAGQ